MSRRRGPTFPRTLFRLLLSRSTRDDVIAELDEEYIEHARVERGAIGARLWYWRQAVGSVLWGARDGGARAMNGRPGFADALRFDVRYALRSLRHAPGFTLLSVATMALGIAVSSTAFSVLDGIVLRPLPYPAAHELVRVWPDWNISKGMAELLFEDTDTFADMTGLIPARETLTGGAAPDELYGAEVFPGFLRLFGATPLHGRFFVEEETVPGADNVVVLSESAWRRLLGGDANAIGETLEIGGQRLTLVGVVPDEHRSVVEGAEFWKPMRIDPDDFSDYQGVSQVTIMGRLLPDVTLEVAREGVRRFAQAMHEENPTAFGDDWVTGSRPVSLHESLVDSSRTALWTVMAAAGFLLLIACANVANLTLARATARSAEISLRLSLGSSAGRLSRQLLTESVLLGLAGGAAGLGLSLLALRSARALLPGGLPLTDAVQLDARVALFALVASFGTSVLFGLAPAWRALRMPPEQVLRGAGPTTASSREAVRLNRLFVTVEIALAVVLAVGAGLALRSLQQMVAVDTGLQVEDVTTLRVRLPANSSYAEGPQRTEYFQQLHERLARLGGVDAVGVAAFQPLRSGLASAIYKVSGVEYPEDLPPPNAAFQLVIGDYFPSVGIPLLAGRLLDSTDVQGGPYVGVINRTFAEREFESVQAAVGKQVTMFGGVEFEVVGVVEDAMQQRPGEEMYPHAYFTYAQADWWPSMHVFVRAEAGQTVRAEDLRAAVWELDPQVPVLSIRPLEEVVRAATEQPRYLARLLALFGLVALVLGAVGVYGLMSYAVGRRLREFGIRSALGANRRRIISTAVRDALRPALVGTALGCAAAAAGARFVRGMLYEVQAVDPVTYVVVPAVLLAVAFAASYLPARRAARVDPRRLLAD